MRIKIPKQVKIGLSTYKIEWTKVFAEGKKDIPGIKGYCDWRKKEIFLKKELKKDDQELEHTYTHEILHAIVHEYTHDNRLVSNEALIRFLTDLVIQKKLKLGDFL